jgi:secondary thiamine-phosphate synthase enzyme
MHMKIINSKIALNTKGNPDLINITDRVQDILSQCRLEKGNVTVFIVGSTAAVMTFEFEPGLVKDINDFYEKVIPQHKPYAHDQTWGDANGYSHLRAALQGPCLVVPFDEGRLLLGTWQQLVLAEFDNRPRKRQVIVQVIGE